jgi:hypothetical protein
MKKIIGLIAILLVSCSSIQYTVFKPQNETDGWKIECEQTFGKYILKVDSDPILIGKFTLFDNNFETGKVYKGHKIQMIGHQRTVSTSSSSDYITLVQIRVIVDDSEITKFDF